MFTFAQSIKIHCSAVHDLQRQMHNVFSHSEEIAITRLRKHISDIGIWTHKKLGNHNFNFKCLSFSKREFYDHFCANLARNDMAEKSSSLL